MKQILKYDVVIIGAGASGLTCAINIKQLNNNITVAVIEKNSRVGQKILLTGNGKCNISNTNIEKHNYYSFNKTFIKTVLNNYKSSLVFDFWQSLGIPLRSDSSGRLYPYNEQASSILNALRNELKRLCIFTICDQNVSDIIRGKNDFLILTNEYKIVSKNLIIATGGMATYKNSNDSSIFSLIEKLGHKKTTCFPALVPITFDSQLLKILNGVRAKCSISLLADYKLIKKEFGEVQFNKNYISGICSMQLSKFVSEFFNMGSINSQHFNTISISIDFMPDFNLTDILNLLKKRINLYPNIEISDILSAMINKKLSIAIIKSLKLNPCKPAFNFNNSFTIRSIAKLIKNFNLSPTGTLSFKNAQAMAGGLDCSQFDPLTFESKIIEHLFAIGEVLDVVGDCGGFNLHFAWLSALICSNFIGESYDTYFKSKS